MDSVRYWGKYKGFVRDNKDPENRGRIRVYCPQVMGGKDSKENWLGWATPCFPWLGGLTAGDLGPPFTREQQIADYGKEWFGVWVEFERGLPDFPIWVGTFPIAPLPTDESALQMGVDGGEPVAGGNILSSASGELDAIANLKPRVGRELRLRAPKGVDIFIGSNKGGGILVGASGVHIVGAQVSLNGRQVLSSSTKVTI